MTSIGIIGAGIAGLHLGLFLRQRSVAATIHTEKSADELRGRSSPRPALPCSHRCYGVSTK
jgi:2-polyprenyl-6-methoxyphenol hydroxylase-like FAD-dependent oxidoreductase